MTTNNAAIDYINTHFEYPELTKIHGKPDYESLKTIKDELKTNAGSVTSSLAGGTSGHLGLVLTPTEMALVTAIPYVRPVQPPALVLPTGPGVTNLQREIARDLHTENVRLFKETVNVEKALIKQLVKALPPIYTKSFRNPHSNSITDQLVTVLQTLFTTYGKVNDEEVKEAR